MAKKSKGNDNILMYVIIGIVSLIIGLSIALIILTNIENENILDYTDNEFVDKYLMTYDSFDNQSEDVYGVYVYNPSCAACKMIKQEVLESVISNGSDLKIYLADTSLVSGDSSVIMFEGYVLQATPTMLVYRDGELVDLIEGGGSNDIPAFLDDVDRGNYSN